MKRDANDLIETILRTTRPIIKLSSFHALHQQIKAHFYNREYDAIFSNDALLPIYTAAYIPSRVLCYHHILSTSEHLKDQWVDGDVYCIGAGAGSELVAILSLYTQGTLHVTIQDKANWADIVNALAATCHDAWNIPRELVQVEYQQGDILACTEESRASIRRANVILSMFVMNELFTDKKEAMHVIRMLIDEMKSGAYFVMVESAGSFSNIQIGNNRYMVYMLFDGLKQYFRQLEANDAVWYRYPKGLRVDTTIELNNMRYFIRVYQRI
jgi:25S rRNA (uracil2843-N3)-methyltransferase